MRMGMRAIAIPAGLICALSSVPARAAFYELSASGTIESSNETTIPVGTPWTLDLIYDTDAPDLDFTVNGGRDDPTFGRFTDTNTPPALLFFHYQAGSYAATVNSPADFGPFSKVQITFTSVHAIDIDIIADDSFPLLAGGNVFFHADFNDLSSRPIFTSDGLPTDPDLGPGSFDQSTVSVLTHSGVRFVEADGHTLATLKVTPVPEPSGAALMAPGLLAVFGLARRRARAVARRAADRIALDVSSS